MTVLVIVLTVFAGAMLYVLPRRFPNARNTLIAYGLTTVGGGVCLIWKLTAYLPLGILAAICFFIGAVFGVVGLIRKELRLTL